MKLNTTILGTVLIFLVFIVAALSGAPSQTRDTTKVAKELPSTIELIDSLKKSIDYTEKANHLIIRQQDSLKKMCKYIKRVHY